MRAIIPGLALSLIAASAWAQSTPIPVLALVGPRAIVSTMDGVTTGKSGGEEIYLITTPDGTTTGHIGKRVVSMTTSPSGHTGGSIGDDTITMDTNLHHGRTQFDADQWFGNTTGRIGMGYVSCTTVGYSTSC